ncbi:MAG: AraC family transcriptional regulator [Polyangiales bacterium]
MDLLSDLLRTVRLGGSIMLRAEFSAPWQYATANAAKLAHVLLPRAKRLIQFHYIARGTCVARVGAEQQELGPGDAIVFPYGDQHVMGHGDAPVEDIFSVLPEPPPWKYPPQISAGGGGETTEILCGFLHCDDALFNPLFDSLPRMMVARADEGPTAALLSSGLQTLAGSLREKQPGSVSIRERLTELLFVEVVRQHASNLSPEQAGWVAAISDEGIRRSLELIHRQPENDWSVEELAKHAGMSRSSFHDRFTDLLDDSPAHYLMRWRMQRAAHLLLDSDDTLFQIAGRVGYGSEAAFSRAFKRHSGESPSVWRQDRGSV